MDSFFDYVATFVGWIIWLFILLFVGWIIWRIWNSARPKVKFIKDAKTGEKVYYIEEDYK